MPRCQHHQLQCHGRIGLPPLGPNFPGVCVGTLECGYALQMQIGDMAEAGVRGGAGRPWGPCSYASALVILNPKLHHNTPVHVSDKM